MRQQAGGRVPRLHHIQLEGERAIRQLQRRLSPFRFLAAARQPVARSGLHQPMDGDGPAAHIDQRISPQSPFCAVKLHGVGKRRRDQLRVDIVRRQEGDQEKQFERFRRFGLKPLEGDAPGGGHRVVEQFAGTAAVEREVFCDRAGVGFDICAGLLQRQRQAAQGIAQLAGGRGLIATASLLQELDGVGARQHGELQRLGETAPVRVARGDQDVTAAARRQMVAAIGGAAGVIQDQQPAGSMAQP